MVNSHFVQLCGKFSYAQILDKKNSVKVAMEKPIQAFLQRLQLFAISYIEMLPII